MRGEQLSRDHPLQFVFRTDASEAENGSLALIAEGLLIRMFDPKRPNSLIDDDVVPGIRSRSADVLESALQIVGIMDVDPYRLLAS